MTTDKEIELKKARDEIDKRGEELIKRCEADPVFKGGKTLLCFFFIG